MVNQQLLDYIKQQLQQGTGKEQIKNSLISNGWQTQDVDSAFSSLALSDRSLNSTNTNTLPQPQPQLFSQQSLLNSMNLPLDKKKIIKKTLEKYSIFLLFLAFGGMVAGMGFMIPELKWWLITIGITLPIISVICVYIYQFYYYKLYFYDFENDKAQIRKGVISRSTGHVRYERIQNVYVDQDILDRIFGLFDVHYETAGEISGAYSHVDGLNKKNADKLVNFLNDKLYKQNEQINQNSKNLNNISEINKATTTGEVVDRNVVPMSKRIVTKNTIIMTIVYTLVISFVVAELLSTNEIYAYGGVIITIYLSLVVLIFIGSYIYYRIWFKNFYFRFSDKSGIIKSQVIALSSSYIYYDRIQNVNIHQGIIDRIFGLYSVTIETAAEIGDGSGGTELGIPGLSNSGAEKIKDFLLAKVDVYKNRL